MRIAVNGSFALNIALLGAKLLAAFLSGSMAVIASAADSALDLVSGAVLFLSQRAVARVDVYQYPEGKARFEPLGVVIFAAVMGMASLQIMVEASNNILASRING